MAAGFSRDGTAYGDRNVGNGAALLQPAGDALNVDLPAGLRPTLPRAMVLEFFRTCPEDHFSAEQVYKLLNGDTRNVSLATVYRVLAQLVDVNLVSSAAFGDGRMGYELNNGDPHDHIVCTACGEIAEFFDAEIEARQKVIADLHDFAMTSRQMVLYGVCAGCRATGARLKAVAGK